MNNTAIEILLVEDNLNDAELTMRALSKSKFTNKLVHVRDGAMAIDFLFGKGIYEGRNINNRPKLILLDLKMPKMDGIEVLTVIKAHELTKQIPVVVLTSSKENPDIERSYALGANSYIVKPVEFDSFIKAVSEIGAYWLSHNQYPVQ